MKKIVVGVDDSAPSRQALRWGHTLAQATGAELEAVTIWTPITSYGWIAGEWIVPDTPRDSTTDAEEMLERVVKDALGENPIRRRVLAGNVVAGLVEASKEAEMLILGSRGRGTLLGTLLGSVSAPCAERAKCPVLVVHEKNDPPVPVGQEQTALV